MKNRLRLQLYLQQNLFVHILASRSRVKVPQSLEVWAYYKLGMYNYVVNSNVQKADWKVNFAKIVSLASLGKYEEAQHLLKDYKKYCQNKNIKLLISSIASYMPEIALNYSPKVQLQSTLEIALRIRLGEIESAFVKVKELIEKKKYRDSPEFLLYYSNIASNFTSRKKLTLLNKFLAQYGLKKLKLKDKNASLSINNLNADAIKVYNEKLVSVIMTVYNSSQYLYSAITSVLKQSYENIELIIVDDCSEDNSIEIIQSIMQYDNRIRLIKLQKNVGTYVAKNIALEIVKGDFVTCHDSDDYSHPLKIEMQVLPLINNSKLIATISSWIRLDEQGIYYTRYLHPLMRMNLSSLMFRKRVVMNKIGYYDSVRTGADSEFYARLVLAFGKKSIKRLKKPLSFGSHRENSLMTSKISGYNENGISLSRLEYWERWNNWHIEQIESNQIPYITFNKNDLENTTEEIKDKNEKN